MPYVDPQIKQALLSRNPASAAELCYAFIEAMKVSQDPMQMANLSRGLFEVYANRISPVRWQAYCEIMGAVAGAAGEVQRRGLAWKYGDKAKALTMAFGQYYFEVIGPYEDEAIKRNGDVF